MRWPLALLSGMALVALCSGCRASRSEHVEQALRARDCDLRELRGEMDRLLFYNKALQQEVHGLRGDVPPGPGMPEPPLLSQFPVRSLTLGRQTSGFDTGSCSGDSALQVVLEPRDCDDHVIKVPAAARILVLEISSEGTKKPLSDWSVSPEQLRVSWKSGLFGSGYTLILNWKVYPTKTKLRVIAQLLMPDGRVLEAEKDITVKLVPLGQQHTPVEPDGKAAPDGGKAAPNGKGPMEDPFFPAVPGVEKLRTPPKPVDLGPNLPPPMPPPGSSTSASDWGSPAPVPSTSGWGAPRTSPASDDWGAPANSSWGNPIPARPAAQLNRPQPPQPDW